MRLFIAIILSLVSISGAYAASTAVVAPGNFKAPTAQPQATPKTPAPAPQQAQAAPAMQFNKRVRETATTYYLTKAEAEYIKKRVTVYLKTRNHHDIKLADGLVVHIIYIEKGPVMLPNGHQVMYMTARYAKAVKLVG